MKLFFILFAMLVIILPSSGVIRSQSDICTAEIVVNSFATAITNGNVEEWAREYASSDCPESIINGVGGLADSYNAMQATSTITLTSTPLVTTIQQELPTAGEYPVISLANPLGIETTIEVQNSYSNDRTLDSQPVSGYCYPCVFVEIAPDIYIISTLKSLRQAYEDNGQHIVTFDDGSEIKGKLRLTVNGTDGREYDLSSATHVSLVSLPESQNTSIVSPSVGSPSDYWTLQITKPTDAVYSVSDPHFVFEYNGVTYSIIGTASDYFRYVPTSLFYLTVNDQSIAANLSDFEEITFLPSQDGFEISAAVKAPSGKETTGLLSLKYQSDPGILENVYRWYLVMNLSDSDKVLAIGRKAEAILRKAKI